MLLFFCQSSRNRTKFWPLPLYSTPPFGHFSGNECRMNCRSWLGYSLEIA